MMLNVRDRDVCDALLADWTDIDLMSPGSETTSLLNRKFARNRLHLHRIPRIGYHRRCDHPQHDARRHCRDSCCTTIVLTSHDNWNLSYRGKTYLHLHGHLANIFGRLEPLLLRQSSLKEKRQIIGKVQTRPQIPRSVGTNIALRHIIMLSSCLQTIYPQTHQLHQNNNHDFLKK